MKAIETVKQVQEIKPLIDSASYLIKQIEICDKQLSNLLALPPHYRERLQDEITMWETNIVGYIESLNRVKAQLCAS